jgi:hypothetical protein
MSSNRKTKPGLCGLPIVFFSFNSMQITVNIHKIVGDLLPHYVSESYINVRVCCLLLISSHDGFIFIVYGKKLKLQRQGAL